MLEARKIDYGERKEGERTGISAESAKSVTSAVGLTRNHVIILLASYYLRMKNSQFINKTIPL